MKLPRSMDYLAWVSTSSVLRTIFPKFPGLELTSESSNRREQEWPSKTTDLLRCLITHGLDVNEEYYHPRADDATTTLWTTIFSKITPYDPARFLELGDTFMSFLEEGLFLLFLRHGADRNAKVYRDVSSRGRVYSIAWIDYLLIASQIPPGLICEARYLEGLDDFISGVDLNEKISNLFFSQDAKAPGCQPSALEILLGLDRSSGVKRLPFHSYLLADVMEKLLTNACSHTQQAKIPWLTIERVLPPETIKRLKVTHHAPSSNKAGPGNKRKRQPVEGLSRKKMKKRDSSKQKKGCQGESEYDADTD
ncbi:hypothetical protein FCOIX_11925 [Fusarium coicis]|nr:hypothetical protein FCOIX_11925 [Fusarium coicis]